MSFTVAWIWCICVQFQGELELVPKDLEKESQILWHITKAGLLEFPLLASNIDNIVLGWALCLLFGVQTVFTDRLTLSTQKTKSSNAERMLPSPVATTQLLQRTVWKPVDTRILWENDWYIRFNVNDASPTIEINIQNVEFRFWIFYKCSAKHRCSCFAGGSSPGTFCDRKCGHSMQRLMYPNIS